eukprot:CAMPEP_0172619170 /NCGR_PEP_ID=MMETSP1068-20121228/90622_1 /TAXON_ID=35684 /ORGANISM="Pseudopedinella elastica, Strain CCMP716" /LENGTH=280 /DNA_ID=CAMNT_0013425775 /DNA_START=187 /DNA_END=1025 /DNA_ORIENTATION=-
MDCLSAPAPMKKHRNRLRAGRAFYMLFSLLHFAIGIFMAVEKCPFGWHVIGFTLFGVLLLRERSLASNLTILMGYQLLLFVNTAHAMWHFNDRYSKNPVEVKWDHGPKIAHRPTNMEHVKFDHAFDLPGREKRPRLSSVDDPVEGAANPSSPQGPDGGLRAHAEALGAAERKAPLAPLASLAEDLGPWPQPLVKRGGRGGAGPPAVDPSVPLGFTGDLVDLEPDEVRKAHPAMFQGLPARGFDPRFRNPCWESAGGGAHRAHRAGEAAAGATTRRRLMVG